jgi:urease accessory protein
MWRRLCLVFFLLSSFALAHNVGGTGFLTGLVHPVLGFDHFLAMVSVGIWSAQIGGRAIWYVPATFVSFMIIGGVVGMSGVEIPIVEVGIALSVFLLGIAIATERFIAVWIGLIFVSFFGIFHGHAHGVEMPLIINPLLYAIGFVSGTAMIHILGVIIGIFATRIERYATILRYMGAGIAGVGLHIFISFIPLISVMMSL